MTQVCRKKLGLTSEGVVIKTINKAGKRNVSEPQQIQNCYAGVCFIRVACSQIRSGGKRLKETGLYPKEFAEAVVNFHIGHKVGFQIYTVLLSQL